LEDPEINGRISLKWVLDEMGRWRVDYIRFIGGLDIQWYRCAPVSTDSVSAGSIIRGSSRPEKFEN
jgi:hypothetical protein